MMLSQRSKYGFLFCLALLLQLNSFAQNKTISEKDKNTRTPAAKHKVLLIPFEPRLYMGEIDYAINKETQLSSRQIKNKFRDGLNDQIYKALKLAKFDVIDLMEDTLKYKKDTEGIYQYLTYEYQKVPNQENYQPPKKEVAQKTIDKGQINVETNGDKRFMNAKLSSSKVLPMLYAKYKTDLFIFINQLDIKADGSTEPGQITTVANPNRKIVLHYTIYTKDAKEINSGTVEEEFNPELNQPKKIIDKHFSKIATTLVQRLVKNIPISK